MADGPPSQKLRPDNRLTPVFRVISLLSLAFDYKKLLLAGVGIALLAACWWILDFAFHPIHPALDVLAPARTTALFSLSTPGGPSLSVSNLWLRVLEPYRLLAVPFASFINWGQTGQTGSIITSIHAILSFILAIVTWSIVGGAICRMATIQLSQSRKASFGETLAYTKSRILEFVIAPLCPLLGIAVGILAALPFGLIYWVPVVGPILASLLFIIPLTIGVVITLLATGLIAGWPLFPAAIAAGADDALDALSRGFSYLNQRLGLFAVMLVASGVVGVVGLVLTDLFAEVVVNVSVWTVTILAPSSVAAEVFSTNASPGLDARIHSVWIIAVRLLPQAWIHSYFWSAAALIYLTLRRDIDGTLWDEINPPSATPANPISSLPPAKPPEAPTSLESSSTSGTS